MAGTHHTIEIVNDILSGPDYFFAVPDVAGDLTGLPTIDLEFATSLTDSGDGGATWDATGTQRGLYFSLNNTKWRTR